MRCSVGTSRERNTDLASASLYILENKVAFVLAGSIIHGAMRLPVESNEEKTSPQCVRRGWSNYPPYSMAVPP